MLRSDVESHAEHVIQHVREVFGEGYIPLHRPVFAGSEKQYLIDCIDSNFVSSVGERVSAFERSMAEFTGARFAVATVSGTAALHVALLMAGVKRDEEVISQALTFVATCNAISYIGASPVFIDADLDTMGMSPEALARFLLAYAERRDNAAWNKRSGRRIAACVPMHTFGLPCRIAEIRDICLDWGIPLVEDAAESLGSYSDGRHTGSFGLLGTFSFNGNKIVTTGGGGMIITDDESLARRAKHITTTAKMPHAYEFAHDEIGYNYRLPNLNAALGCAQLERLSWMLDVKKEVSAGYQALFASLDIPMAAPVENSRCNHWLNAIVLPDRSARDAFLHYTNERNVMTRPIWRLMSELDMFGDCQNDGLENSHWLEERVVNVPSSIPDNAVRELLQARG